MASSLSLAPSRRPNASLTLLTRALREDNRLKQGYLARTLVVAFVLLMMVESRTSYNYSGAPGLSFFHSVVGVNLFFISVAGLGYFAGAITEEKEEGTLGLLRMTGMKALSILLGKSTSRLCSVVLLLLAQLPFTLLAVTLGGVSNRQVLAVYATLGAYIFLLANLALLASVVATRTRTATFFTGTILALFLAGPYLLISTVDASYAWRNRPTPPLPGLHAFLDDWRDVSPFEHVDKILKVGYVGPIAGQQVALSVAMGLLCFALAWMSFDFCTRGAAADGAAAGGRHWWQRRFVVLPGRAWRLAVLWKDYQFLTGGWTGLTVRVLFYALLAGGVIASTGEWSGRPRVWGVNWRQVGDRLYEIGLIFIGGELAIFAAQIWRSEIDGKTLSALAMLPSSLDRQMIQKTAAGILMLIPAGCFCAAGVVLDQTELLNWPNLDYHWRQVAALGLESAFVMSLIVYFSFRMRLLAIPMALAAAFFATAVFGEGFSFILQRWNLGGYGGDYNTFSLLDRLILGSILLLTLLLLWRIRAVLPKLAAEN